MNANVLVAEDDVELRNLIVEELSSPSVRVVPAGDGVEALEILTVKKGIELLLSDVQMPNMGGFELVEKALACQPDLKVLMMTGHALEFPPKTALTARELRVLPKPFSMDKLSAVVFELLSRP